jgi:hypothetical protein
MCNVMCEWLEIADVRMSSSKHGSSGGALGAAGASSAAAAAGGAAADGGIPDEFTLLTVRVRVQLHGLKSAVDLLQVCLQEPAAIAAAVPAECRVTAFSLHVVLKQASYVNGCSSGPAYIRPSPAAHASNISACEAACRNCGALL